MSAPPIFGPKFSLQDLAVLQNVLKKAIKKTSEEKRPTYIGTLTKVQAYRKRLRKKRGTA